MTSYPISQERIRFPGKTDAEIATSLAHKHGYLVVMRFKSSPSSDYDHFACCYHDYEVDGYFTSPYCHDTEILYDARTPIDIESLSCVIGIRGRELVMEESFLSLAKQMKLNTPTPLGVLPIVYPWGIRSKVVIFLKVLQTEFDSLRNTSRVDPTMDFIPTEHYPNLWFRLHIDDRSGALFSCEYHFNILADLHTKILDSMLGEDHYLVVYFNDSCTETSGFFFTITEEKKAEMVTEIEACRNGLALYHALGLDTDKFVKGQIEIANSRDVSGKMANIDLVKKQSRRRLSVKPLPVGAEIKFV